MFSEVLKVVVRYAKIAASYTQINPRYIAAVKIRTTGNGKSITLGEPAYTVFLRNRVT